MPGRMPPLDTVAILDQRIHDVVTPLASGRQLPETPEEWLRATAIAVPVLALAILVGYLIRRRLFKSQDSELESLMAESAGFYTRWSRGHLASAPLAELQGEANRCLRIITLLQWRIDDRGDDSTDANSQIGSVQGWLATVQAARDLAARRENGMQVDPRLEPPY